MDIKNRVRKNSRPTIFIAVGLVACLGLIGGGPQAFAGVPTGLPATQPTQPTQAKSSKVDATVLQDTANGHSTSFVVLLTSQADLSAAWGMRDHDARGWYVYNTLRSHADKTQASLRALLDVQGVQYQSFWAANMLVVHGDRPLVDLLAARTDVAHIESNRPSNWIETPDILDATPANESPNVIEWGVQNVNAPQVWAMGYNGTGIVVGNQDTGIRWTHLAIKNQYRGWNGATADHNYNWWDAIHSGGGICGPNTQAPCDDDGHGTHTTGTSVGDDGNPGTNQIGVAPGARWIGCRNMNVGVGTPATYTECFQFFIAPTDLAGQNPNPALRPHVMNNSWSCPPSEGCAANTLEVIVNSTQAAGIFVAASAMNSGPACGTVSSPPAIYEASFSTGAYDISNVLAGFSSRGPVTVDGSNRLKPNISGPGVSVRSATNAGDTSYSNFSGTSMAGPHVVGVVALLWDARPQLVRDIANTKAILQNTANPNIIVSPPQTCNGIPHTQIPNNSFGYGRVDALAAVNSLPLLPVGNGFTYQGQLKSGGNPANGQYDFTFKLYDALQGGNQVGATQTSLNVTVAQGLFTIDLDFGPGAFQGDARWLDIAVRASGGGTYTTLSPRTAITSVPYASSLRPGGVINGQTTLPILSATNAGTGTGLYGSSSGVNGWGVRGIADNGGLAIGVYGSSPSGTGVYGLSTGSGGTGVTGNSQLGIGVYGRSSTLEGVVGYSSADGGKGVKGLADNGLTATGVYGESPSGYGVQGRSTAFNGTGIAGYGDSGDTPTGVYGYARGSFAQGVVGVVSNLSGSNSIGVYGFSDVTNGRAVLGYATQGTLAKGVQGLSENGYGVYATAPGAVGWGLYATGGQYAGYFQGNVRITGTCCGAGALYSKIDHPLDPANKYLNHAAVESQDMMNIYSGNVTTDAKGEAVVTLPDWFEALNKDFRYQLTILGEQFAQARVSSEIKNNSFTIKTDKPNVKVSWQVTGIRKDAYAEAHRIPVEEVKPQGEQGTYLHPEFYGQPESKRVHYERTKPVEQKSPQIEERKP